MKSMLKRVAMVVAIAFISLSGAVTEANAYTAPTVECFLAPCPIVPRPPIVAKHHRKAHHKFYKVKPGDTLWHIAVISYGGKQHAGHRWHDISSANGLDSSVIHPGQILVIPLP